ncbi:MAG TPA: peroxiredoxin [Kofleriaceae bacterium]|nr:peroxiredoxin [Kofleriaceae bacterium]
MSNLSVGDPVPDVSFLGPDGPVRLKDLVGDKVLVLYFYPKDETTGCTAEACSFRDRYQDFTDAGADVVGVSTDTQKSHDSFKSHHRLPFRLLTDEGGAAAKAMGVKKTLGIIPGRSTFVIDPGGVVRLRWDGQMGAVRHVDEALRYVKSMAKATPAS